MDSTPKKAHTVDYAILPKMLNRMYIF